MAHNQVVDEQISFTATEHHNLRCSCLPRRGVQGVSHLYMSAALERPFSLLWLLVCPEDQDVSSHAKHLEGPGCLHRPNLSEGC